MLKNKALIKSQGFTLLEMIIVIAIAGLIMSGIAVAIQKTVSHKARKLEAEAVVQEVENFLRFVNADKISWYSTVNNAPNPDGIAVNPLYDTGAKIKGNEIYKISDPNFSHLKENTVDVSPFFKRVYYPSGNPVGIPDAGLFSAGNGRNFYSWPLMWSSPGVRENFLDGLCVNKGHVGFKEQYLSCRENPLLKSGSLSIERIDLVSSEGTINHENPRAPAPANTKSSGIDRVDVFVAYNGDINEPAKMYTYFLPLTDAFDKSGLAPNPDDSMYLVERTGADHWQFVSKPGRTVPGVPVNSTDLISYRDLPGNIDHLHAGHHYGIRFSFDGNGKFLKPDGSVSTSKLCWNASNNLPGPCLVPSNDGGTLMAQDGKDPGEMANLQAASMIMKRVDPVTHAPEYYTAPYIQTRSFSNTTLAPCRGELNNGQVEVYCGWPSQPATLSQGFPTDHQKNTNGAIIVSQPNCSQALDEATGVGIQLHQRLDVSIKDVLAGLPNTRNNPANINGADFVQGDVSGISIQRFGGSYLTVSHTGNGWRVTSEMAIEDLHNAGHLWQYVNPPWMSVQLSMWCSSIPQP